MGTRFIFVTGGVTSSLGKGIAASSLACLLEGRGFRVTLQKMDPYINIDPGTMSPYQHGEVYVTSDGAETDLDLGNYERFTTSAKISRINSVTTGQIYLSVIERERRGEYKGGTVQVIPHITDEIKARILMVADESRADFVIVEIGGTVGDIESIPFLEAIRQFSHDIAGNSLFIHLTLVPHIETAGEYKTKPTQHSVKELRSLGIRPDILLCRISERMSVAMKEKIALFCDVESDAVIEALDINTTIYEVPILYSKEGLDDLVLKKFNLDEGEGDLSKWEAIIKTVKNPECDVVIGVVGKYIELQDAYKSLYAAINHGAIANRCRVRLERIHSEGITEFNIEDKFRGLDGIVIAGGFGERGIAGKLFSCSYARERGLPAFGICLGMQCMVIEYARNVCGLLGANSTEFDKGTLHPVISLLEEQEGVKDLGGTMRLGEYEARIVDKASKVYRAYGVDRVFERHRHRYEFSNEYRGRMESGGMRIVGINEEKGLVEAVELVSHPWYVGVQYHPEFQSKPVVVHPLFRDFIGASVIYSRGRAV